MSPTSGEYDRIRFFSVLVVDVKARRGDVALVEGRNEVMGGSGLAALLFAKYGLIGEPAFHPDQRLFSPSVL
jgi:aldehyde:ferredoxin oxidoreductase